MRRHRLLFICKRRQAYWGDDPAQALSSGLRNSVAFVVQMLQGLGVHAQMFEVDDNNAIDRLVTLHRPSHVFIEAFWVVPEKFDVLTRLHPHVRWIVRNHSETPFLSNEGIAIEWVAGYLRRGIEVNCNSVRAAHDLKVVAHSVGANDALVTYLPNYYPRLGHHAMVARPQAEAGHVHVGCFGAIRPLKNQLAQAIAAVAFTDALGLRLCFHINGSRVEGNGSSILKNLRALFANSARHRLVEHPWCSHGDFLDVLRRIDIAMQVSFSETFNIVSADAVAVGTPVVASAEVSWLGQYAMALPTDTAAMAAALWQLWEGPQTQRLFAQVRDLHIFLVRSEEAWGQRFADHHHHDHHHS